MQTFRLCACRVAESEYTRCCQLVNRHDGTCMCGQCRYWYCCMDILFRQSACSLCSHAVQGSRTVAKVNVDLLCETVLVAMDILHNSMQQRTAMLMLRHAGCDNPEWGVPLCCARRCDPLDRGGFLEQLEYARGVSPCATCCSAVEPPASCMRAPCSMHQLNHQHFGTA